MNDQYIKPIKMIHIHPNYLGWKLSSIKRHDLALIELVHNQEMEFLELTSLHKPSTVSVTGWGKREDGSYPKIPFAITNLNVLPNASDFFWNQHLHLLVSDDNTQDFIQTFFTGDYLAIEVKGGRSACRGDSGAPVYNEHNEILGIVSHGQSDCINQSVFYATSIESHRQWIEEIIK